MHMAGYMEIERQAYLMALDRMQPGSITLTEVLRVMGAVGFTEGNCRDGYAIIREGSPDDITHRTADIKHRTARQLMNPSESSKDMFEGVDVLSLCICNRYGRIVEFSKDADEWLWAIVEYRAPISNDRPDSGPNRFEYFRCDQLAGLLSLISDCRQKAESAWKMQ